MDSIAEGLKPGSAVRAGMVLGKLGSTGNATADFPHKHLEIYPSLAAYREGGTGSSRISPEKTRVNPRDWYARTFPGLDTAAAPRGPAPPVADRSIVAGRSAPSADGTVPPMPGRMGVDPPGLPAGGRAALEASVAGSSLGQPLTPLTDQIPVASSPAAGSGVVPPSAPSPGAGAGPSPGAGLPTGAGVPASALGTPPPAIGGDKVGRRAYGPEAPIPGAPPTLDGRPTRFPPSVVWGPQDSGGGRVEGAPLLVPEAPAPAGAALVEPIAPSGPGDTGPDGEPAPAPPIAAPAGTPPGSEGITPSTSGGISAPSTSVTGGTPMPEYRGGDPDTTVAGRPPGGSTTPATPVTSVPSGTDGQYPQWARDAFQWPSDQTRSDPFGGPLGAAGGSAWQGGKIGQIFGFGSGPVQIPTMKNFFGSFFGGFG